MSDEPKFVETLNASYGRYDYKCKAINLHNLKTGNFIESFFDVAGKKWTLALIKLCHNCGQFDIAKVMLNSCNAEKVTAYVDMTVTNTKNGKVKSFERQRNVATRFNMLTREDIRISELTGSDEFGPDDELIIALNLTYIKTAVEESENGPTLRPVTLDLVNRKDIEKWLGEEKLGLVPQIKSRHSDVDNRSFVRAWACSNKDKRYWLCTRSEHGDLIVKRCLSDAGLLEIFENVSEEDGTDLWVTVFEEEKKSHLEFVPINDNTVIIFCKLLDPGMRGSTYLGYLLVDKNTSCVDLLTKILSTFDCFLPNSNYKAFLEREGDRDDITALQKPLPEFKGEVGYVIALREEKTKDKDVSDDTAAQELNHQMESSNPEPAVQRPPREASGKSDQQGPSAPSQGDDRPQASAVVQETKSESNLSSLNSHALTPKGHPRFHNIITAICSVFKLCENCGKASCRREK